ncbi:MAG: STAS domain-containing protein [gamma proteobacterium endosymbiont of Lamellibrachia anaximandri]|nr:STAS domain-containing protein [gamma proteobacterium endosymbiont of Lamellibrachia anaximandri]MBL3534523.1 STAS domain-containing protein [gamma proteobacterium endosymbiont of Lamellibrachia anaximandri]MBL3600364.1 STAS domain-containing protein [gamma proteobacterium endosymbiont of Lamellibrachia anaximandri]
MAIITKISGDGRLVRISINGRFDFSQHANFRNAYTIEDAPYCRYEIDLSNVPYMDSSALGMLLVLRERAGGHTADITLIGFNDEIEQILSISRFENLFKLERPQAA